MRILEQKIIQDKYDVVVVGAGIGGITAGALLAKKGLSVLIVEQHYLPGGACTSIKRNDVAMDAGAALLFGWADDYRNPHIFVMNEIEEKIDMIPHESLYRMHFQGGRHVTFWKDFDRFFKELVVAFPGREDQLKGFYDECFKIYDMMTKNPVPYSPDAMPPIDGLKMLLKNPISTIKLGMIMNQTLEGVFEKHISDPEIEGFFDLLIASCYCTVLRETPLMLAAAIIINTHDGGAFYPSGSPQMLPNIIEKGLEKYNGQILYRQMVDEIILENNKAKGIKLANGMIINADQVVSDATIWSLYGKLIKPEHIAPDRMKWAQSFEPTTAAAMAYMTVKKDAFPEGTASIEAFIGDLTVMDQNNYFVYIPSIDDPSICPSDMHSVSLLCSGGDYDWPRPSDSRYQSEEYVNEKNKLLEKALTVIEKRFPKFRESIVTVDTASPSTTERFTLKDFGNIGGPKQNIGQHLMNRLKARTEFDGVYAVGDSTVMGEGVISVTASAVGAANTILKDLRMKPFQAKKSEKSYVNYVKGQPRKPLPPKQDGVTVANSPRIAVECQWCQDQKCVENCPAGIDVPTFVRKLESGNIEGAAKTIRENNPLGAICGILCPSEKLCESVCNRLDFSDHPVQIKNLQKFACEEAGDRGWSQSYDDLNGQTVAIVGAGPAGLSSAHYLARMGFKVEIFEKADSLGGMISQALPVHRYSDDTIQTELNQAVMSDRINIQYGKELGKDIKLSELSDNYYSVFLAIGLSSGNTLDLPGVDTVNHIDALGFLKSNRVSPAKLNGQDVLVIGGGSVAVDAAVSAKKQGAKSVKMVCLESREEMPCLSYEVDELDAEGIELINSWGPLEFSGKSGANSLKCEQCTSVFDDEGHFAPAFDSSANKDIAFSDVIFAVGQQFEPEILTYFKGDHPESIIDGKLLINDNFLLKGTNNVYGGGDIIRGGSTIVQAVADGRSVASEINESLRNSQ
ncbi:MAG: FAD-dependent oxidoreductase [Desulfobacteraceae bacterium]|jgi:NADPH-dependent glutamate synthase beta subunit-like oxidoreductase|nr:FAD-dependent oxidoreductase [Desulfobacteraceae bacterium]